MGSASSISPVMIKGVGQVDLQYGNLFMVRPQFRDGQVQRLAREFGGAHKIPL